MAGHLHMIMPILVAFLVFTVSARDFSSSKRLGDWKVLDPKDKKVLEIAKFAETEHDRRKKWWEPVLKYNQVVRAEMKVESGIDYKVYISASHDNFTFNYLAVVFDQPWNHIRNLTNWDCLC